MITLVINLEKSKDRWDNMLNQTKNQDLILNRIDAIYGKDVDLDKIDITPFAKEYNSPNIIGCYLSHVKAWKHVIDNDIEECFIFEDDVYVNKNINIVKRFNIMRKYIPKDTDVILLGTHYHWFINSCLILMSGYKTPKDMNLYFYKPFNFFGLHAYYVTKNSAKKLLDNISTVSYHVDVCMSNCANINTYCLHKPLLRTYASSGQSTTNEVEKNSWYDDIMINNDITFGWLLHMFVIKIQGINIKVYHILIAIFMIIFIIYVCIR